MFRPLIFLGVLHVLNLLQSLLFRVVKFELEDVDRVLRFDDGIDAALVGLRLRLDA
jgi:hypothetical protein